MSAHDWHRLGTRPRRLRLRGRKLGVVLALALVASGSIAAFAAPVRDDGESAPPVWLSGPDGNASSFLVLWHDPYRLLPRGALDGMRAEIESIFRGHGIGLHVHATAPGESFADLPIPSANVVLHPARPTSWGLHRDVMAAAVGESRRGFNVFVFYPAVTRVLDLEGAPKSRRDAKLSRAMGRVVAHELVHVFAPSRGHASDGLMSARLTKRTLLQKTLALDAVSARRARVGALALARKALPVVASQPQPAVASQALPVAASQPLARFWY